ncbi:MAG: xanthine dehydrogenase small subunit [Proteobacteria bacterium]|nr:xanthine dehydrogenase small subunit [Pseudomonadota bacterium]
MRNSIKFLLGSEPRELSGIDPTLTVLDYLQQIERRTGTKEGCCEGDCGACTIVVGTPDGDRLQYRAVNACIMLAASLDGCQLLTVEELAGADGKLHPVQQAMVAAHGSQCGFCTPGFVMSLFALYQETDTAPEVEDVNDALAGNLCRCTGYGPIITAARTMHDLADGPDKFEQGIKTTLEALRSLADEETIHIQGPDGRVLYAPASLDALADLLAEHPDATLVAGATDVGLWITKALKKLDTVIWLGRIAALRGVRETDAGLEIGAMTTYSDAAAAIAALYPDFGEVIRRIGSVPLRNVGTIGGNIANGSPIGDTLPPLIAAGATLILRRGGTRRSLKLENFFIGYGKQDLKAGEFVESVILPRPAPDTRLYCYKISKRFDQDISAVLGAFSLKITDGKVEAARIAYGGMAATPKRASATEAALVGKAWTRETVEQAVESLRKDFTPLDDMRASAQYRMQVAGNLLLKTWLESQSDGADGLETRIMPTRETANA